MKITIECNTLEELKEAVDTICLVFPDRSEKRQKQEKKTAEKPAEKQGRGQKIDRDEIRGLMDEGFSNKDIAEFLGCGYSTVCNIVRELKE